MKRLGNIAGAGIYLLLTGMFLKVFGLGEIRLERDLLLFILGAVLWMNLKNIIGARIRGKKMRFKKGIVLPEEKSLGIAVITGVLVSGIFFFSRPAFMFLMPLLITEIAGGGYHIRQTK